MRFWFLLTMRPANDQTNILILAVSPESSVLAYTEFGLNIFNAFSRIQHTKYNNMTRHVNEKDLTGSDSKLVSLYESNPGRWVDNRYNEGFRNQQNIYANKKEGEGEKEMVTSSCQQKENV